MRHHIFISAILIFLLAICTVSCSRSYSGKELTMAESVLEEYPDSALSILEALQLPNNASERDRSLQVVLLAHARYKNFMDLGADSTLREAAEYFYEHHNVEEASKAFFLLGMQQMGAKRFGEAAISFTRGLNLARENKCYMWEGQCARGLFMLYGHLLDSSAQLKYASEAYDAFSKGGYEDWMDWSKLDLATAYNNKSLYLDADSISKVLMEKAIARDDGVLLEEAAIMHGLALYNLGRYAESLSSYAFAYKMNKEILSSRDKRFILNAASKINDNEITPECKIMIDFITSNADYNLSFTALADQGRFEEAYFELNDYRLRQDSIIEVVLKNNVAELTGEYENYMRKLDSDRERNKTIFSCLLIIVMILLTFSVYYYFRMQLHKKEARISELSANMEGLRVDLKLQMEKSDNVVEEEKSTIARPYVHLIREKYSQINLLCDDYYQNSNIQKNEIREDMMDIVKNFNDSKYLKQIEEYVDLVSGNLYSSFKEEMLRVSVDNRRIFLYYLLGFSPRSISVFLDQKISAIYNKKSRLKADVEKSHSTRKNEYLSVLK